MIQARGNTITEIDSNAAGAQTQRVERHIQSIGLALALLNLDSLFFAIILNDKHTAGSREVAQADLKALKAGFFQMPALVFIVVGHDEGRGRQIERERLFAAATQSLF